PLSPLFLRVLVQPGLEELLQSKALVSPLLVKGTKVKPPIRLVICPGAVVGNDTADIMQGVCQVEKFFLVERFIVRTAAKEEENLMEQTRIRAQSGVRRVNNGFHASARVGAERPRSAAGGAGEPLTLEKPSCPAGLLQRRVRRQT